MAAQLMHATSTRKGCQAAYLIDVNGVLLPWFRCRPTRYLSHRAGWSAASGAGEKYRLSLTRGMARSCWALPRKTGAE